MKIEKLPAKERLHNAAETIINNEGYYSNGSFFTWDDWAGLLDEEIPQPKTGEYYRSLDRRIQLKDRMNVLFLKVYNKPIRLFAEDGGIKLLKGDAAVSRFTIEEEKKTASRIKKTVEYAMQMKIGFVEPRHQKQLDYARSKSISMLETAKSTIKIQSRGMKKSVVNECMAIVESALEYVMDE